MRTTVDDVLEFWFGTPPTTEADVMANERRWFRSGAEMDDDVRRRFGPAVDAAARGELDAWAATPRGRLALVILLDQLTRNVHRGNTATYAGDAKAQKLSLEAFDGGLDRGLDLVERLFLSMPLLHSERPEHHARLASIAREIVADAAPIYRKLCAMYDEQVRKYADVIRRFGRFPHRNAILGRASTHEEMELLRDWERRAPPSAS
jgi:uncharacterized protein (DUF924 family)